MRKVVAGLLGAAMVTAFGATLPTVASAAPPDGSVTAGKRTGVDDYPNPLEEKRRDKRQKAVNDVLKGKLKVEKRGASKVAKLADGTYVELAREKTDRLFVILAEFGNERHPDFPDVDTVPGTPGPVTFDGPLRNKIPQPDRSVDNKTIWQADYNREHYQQLYFGEGAGVESLKTYYEAQSSGRYSVDGEVTDWVKVRYNEARYGRDCDINGDCGAYTWFLVQDAANQWVADQKAAGRTDEQIKADLATFDTYDRYDHDNDGDFNEPDGYLDHFQIVHAGGDEADGDRQQGEDAIWSHRSYAFQDLRGGSTGPEGNLDGGAQVGDTGFWIGDYTVQPENGGLSVFAHEYGHDLGLPDDYDTSGGTNNNTEYWSLMAQSRLNGAGEPIGTRPGDLGAWNKLQLGWLDYEVVPAGKKKTLVLGPEEYNTDNAQAAVVVLPDIVQTEELGAPFAGAKQWFSGNEDNLQNTLTKTVDLTGATSASFDLKGRWNIEEGYDYLYAEVSTNGTNWAPVDGTVNGQPFPKDTSKRPALSGEQAEWADLSVPLTAYLGRQIQVRLRYATDLGVTAGGFFGDNLTITVNGAAQSVDGAEGPLTWTSKGWTTVGSSITGSYDNFYIAGYRTHTSFGKYLLTGPYNYGWPTKPLWAEHFAYQKGLLISYANSGYRDNNVNAHPGYGRNLYVDAHPDAIYNIEGNPWRSRVMLYDAPFSLTRADSMTLHVNGKPSLIRGKAAVPLFDDTRSYFDPAIPYAGVKLPAVGVKIRVVEQGATTMKIRIS